MVSRSASFVASERLHGRPGFVARVAEEVYCASELEAYDDPT